MVHSSLGVQHENGTRGIKHLGHDCKVIFMGLPQKTHDLRCVFFSYNFYKVFTTEKVIQKLRFVYIMTDFKFTNGLKFEREVDGVDRRLCKVLKRRRTIQIKIREVYEKKNRLALLSYGQRSAGSQL